MGAAFGALLAEYGAWGLSLVTIGVLIYHVATDKALHTQLLERADKAEKSRNDIHNAIGDLSDRVSRIEGRMNGGHD